MDDIYQILFILVFIISSIVSSLRKKKKRQQQSLSQTESAQSVPDTKMKQKQKSSSKILEEILGFKVQIPEPPTTEAPTVFSESNDEHTTWDPSTGYEEVTNHKELSYIEKDTLKKINFEKEKQKHRAFKKVTITPKKNVQQSKFKKLFISQSSLKDSIIIQELLNKPKALRR